MPDYGFTLNMSGDVLAAMRRVEKGLQAMAQTASTEVKKIESDLKGMEESLKKVGEAIVGYFAVERIKEFGMELLHLTAEFEGFENIIKYASKNGYDAAQNLDYINGAVRRLHLPLKESMESFSEMEAGFYGTGIEGERLRKVFEGVSTAATVLHLSAFKFGNVTFALKEIGELGTLQARQMRMLAFAMPGAMNLAAKAMHMNTVQFHEAMHHGAISSSVFLPKFAEALQEHYSKGLPNAGNSLIAQMNDTQNALLRMKLELGENLRPLFVDIMKNIRAAFDSEVVKAFVANIRPLVSIAATLVKFWLEYRIALVAVALATKAYAAALVVVEGAQMIVKFGADGIIWALGEMKGALIATGIGAFAIGLGLVIEKMIGMNQKIDEAVEKATNLKSVTEGFNDINERYKRVDIAYGNLGNMNAQERSEMYTDIQAQMADIQKEIVTKTQPSLDRARQNLGNASEPEKRKGESDVAFSGRLEEFWKYQKTELPAAIDKLNSTLSDERNKMAQHAFRLKMLDSLGVKPDKNKPTDMQANAMKENSLHTMGLAGAKGGLGEAKTITIHFHDALQKVTVGTPAGIKAAGQDAIEVILRTLNNLSYAQSKTM